MHIAWEKVHRAFFILYLDVFVVANKVALFCQFENVFDAANGAADLTRCDVEILLVSDRGALYLLHDTVFAKAIAAVEHAGQVATSVGNGVVVRVLRVADDAAAQITFD